MAKKVFLYVEDDPLSRQVMEILFEYGRPDCKLLMFNDSSNFMERLKALPEKPEAILLDIHMRPHDGFALVEMLRHDETYRDATVVAITASLNTQDFRKLKIAGFDGGLPKPVDQDILWKLVESILKGEKIWDIP